MPTGCKLLEGSSQFPILCEFTVEFQSHMHTAGELGPYIGPTNPWLQGTIHRVDGPPGIRQSIALIIRIPGHLSTLHNVMSATLLPS